LDLLISRSLDGDLPAAEERELRDLLAADPAARARYEAMARLVGRLEEIPDPEIPFALATRVNSQVESDTQGLAATLHRFGFYFRPATVFVFVAGLVAVGLTYTLRHPPQPAATVADARSAPAAAPAEPRVSVFFSPSEKKDAAAAPKAEAPAAVAEARRADAAPSRQAPAKPQEPVLVASAESPRVRDGKEEAFAPEPQPAKVAAAPAPTALRQAADFSPAAAGAAAVPATEQAAKSAPAVVRSERPALAAAPAASVPVTPGVEIVGKSAAALRLAAPAKLDGLTGPFEGSYRLELDASGRVTEVVRLFGGSGTEPSGLGDRLRGLSFVPAEAARSAGSVDVKVRIR
jgi:hypothetical protein